MDDVTATRTPWIEVAEQCFVIVALKAVSFPAMTPGVAVRGGVRIHLVFLSRMAVLLALATWFLRMRGLRWTDLGLRRPLWLRFSLAIPIGLLGTGVAVGLARGVVAHTGASDADYSMFEPLKGNLLQYLFWAAPVAWGSAALGEEMLFRGFVLTSLERLAGGRGWAATGFAVIAQAVVFGVLHLYQGVGGAVSAGVTGLVLGLVFVFSGRNLWAGIAIHGILDTSAMTAFYLGLIPHRP